MTTASNVKQQLLEAVHYPHEEFHCNDHRSSPTHVLYPFPPSHCRTVQTPLSLCNIHRMDRIVVFLHVVSLLASHVRVLLLYNSISTVAMLFVVFASLTFRDQQCETLTPGIQSQLFTEGLP